MEPLDRVIGLMAVELVWPKPNQDKTTTLSAAQQRQVQALLGALINYIETQLERCKKEPDA